MIRAKAIVASLAIAGLAFAAPAQSKTASGGEVRAASLVKKGKGAGSSGYIVGGVAAVGAVAIIVIANAGKDKMPPHSP